MRLTVLILITTIVQVNAASFAQKVTLSEKNASLIAIFHKISNQTGYDFLVSSDVLKHAKPVTISVQNEDLKMVLDEIFKDQPLNFVIQEKMIVVTKKEAPPGTGYKEAIVPVTISGKVTDTTGSPLPGATLKIEGQATGIQTRDDGSFSVDAEAGDKIIISYVGYQSFIITAEKHLPFQNIVLHINNRLGGVSVSTGYQTIPKDRATGSFAQVDSTLLNRRVSTDIVSRLEGVVPGLLFNRNTTTSAQGLSDISIRGHSTLFSNDQPLIVLDGFPYDGDLNNINPNDIQSITVLKDAAAASIWGVRSGNGVIVLTTKRGQQGQKLVIDLNANVTIGAKPDLFYSPNFLNATNYIAIEKNLFGQGFYDAQIGDPTQPISPVVQILADQRAGTITAAAANAQIAALQNQDVRNDLSKYFYRKSLAQQYAVSFRGGGAKSDYFFSLGDDHGIDGQVGNSNNRFTLSGNYNFYPVKGLQIMVGLNYVQSQAYTNSPVSNINPGGAFSNYLYPYAQLADAGGNGLPITKDYNADYIATAPQQGLLNWQYNPLDELHNADNRTSSLDNRINLGLSYQLLPGLSAAVRYQFEKASAAQSDYFSTATYYDRNLINQYTQVNSDGSLSYPVPSAGILQQSNAYLNIQRLRGQLNYEHTWNGKHELSAIAGAEISSTVNEGDSNTVYGYDKNTETNYAQIDYLDYFNLNPNGIYGTAQIPNIQGLQKTTDHYISYFSNAAYTFDAKYTISASGRIDRSNLFGVATNQKNVPLFSTGLSWDIAKERFYHLEWLPGLKLRATYGYNANVNKTATAVTTLLQQSNSYFSGVPYDVVANPGNPDLRWEKVRMTNLGVDFNLKNNMLSGSIEYYTKKATDLFGSSPLPPSTGLKSFFGNTASTSGYGADIVINSRNIYQSKFKWTTNLLISHVLDKVTTFNKPATTNNYLNGGSGNSGTITPLAGQPIFAIYSFKSGSLTHDTGDPQGYLNGQLSTDYSSIIAGTKVSDLHYDGPSRPTTFGSLRNNFSYQNWSLSANILFKLDYYFRRSSTGINDAAIVYGVVNQDYARRWQKPGDELTTTVPSIQPPPDDGNRDFFYQYSQSLVDKADNIRFQDVRLAYDFSKRHVSGFPFAHLQVYAYANNIGIIWRANHDHLDPDLYSGAIPLPRTISLGVNATF